MCRAHDRHVRPCQPKASADGTLPPSEELPVRRPAAADSIFLQGIVKKRRGGIRNLNVGENEWMDTQAPYIGKRLSKLSGSTQSRIGLVLRISAINSSDVPAKYLERRYPVLLGVGREPRQFGKPVNDRILGVRKNDGL